MKLSIVIVNYNVKYFLEQCLYSVFSALKDISSEVFVVDNNSVDGSVDMIREKFPQVKLIANKDNPGFAKANNQAIRQSSGEYILLLNPDTVVEENTFSTTLSFMDQHEDAGALGVKMIDGKGHYLPESKRGLPTPWVAFYKIFGFAKLFPRSPRFARYYLGHLDHEKNNEIEILAGAFMLMRKETLDKSGLLDETFFMYGEDIDLSYRILKAGYKNYYCADTSIIHYKGESTKKGSLNYVYVFYKAMVIFAEKHFSSSYATFFRFFILTAIYFRGAVSLLKRVLYALALPAFDFCILMGGLFYIKTYWENNHRFIVGGEYSWELIRVAFPLYTLGWILGIFINGGYEKPTRISQLLKGIFIGSIAIIVGYSLVSEQYRFSRAIILLGAIWATFSIPFSRLILQKFSRTKFLSTTDKSRRIIIIGKEDEAHRVEQIIKQLSGPAGYIAYVHPPFNDANGENYTGRFDQLGEIIDVFKIDEVIFCARDIPGKAIFKKMSELKSREIEIKIAPSESHFVIGSNSIDSQGNWYSMQFSNISKPSNQRAKRLFDIIMSSFMIIFSPLLLWFINRKKGYFTNSFKVLSGKFSWISFNPMVKTHHLPAIKPGILYPSDGPYINVTDPSALNHLNQLYAKNYSVWKDLNSLIANFQKTGREITIADN